MGLFRRRDEETLNEQLLREAGLEPAREEARPTPVPEPQQGPEAEDAFDYDVLVTVEAPAIGGNVVEFATLPDGDVIVETEAGDADLSPLADAIEQQLRPPYRALGERQAGGLWEVAAWAIDVRRFVCKLGDELVLVSRQDEQSLRADGVPTDGWIPELQRAGEEVGSEYVVEALRLDGDLWEIQADAL